MSATSSPFESLQKRQYISLTTFRKNGQAVATPVWFAVAGDRLYVTTGRKSGKVKRIRNNAAVQVAPSDGGGKLLGPAFEATARLLPEEEAGPADEALHRKYGLQLRLFEMLWRWRGAQHIYLEIKL
jgi:PPOX class probable F420-dependent enzyme